MASASAQRVRARCVSGEPADAQPVASDASTAFLLLTCERVLPHESMCVAGEARTRAVCVPSAFCTRVLMCKAVEWERGRGRGEARQEMPVRTLFYSRCSLLGVTKFCDRDFSKLGLFRWVIDPWSGRLGSSVGLFYSRSSTARTHPPLPRVCVVACARGKPHPQNSPHCCCQ